MTFVTPEQIGQHWLETLHNVMRYSNLDPMAALNLLEAEARAALDEFAAARNAATQRLMHQQGSTSTTISTEQGAEIFATAANLALATRGLIESAGILTSTFDAGYQAKGQEQEQ
jgi:hypothetical protein